MFFTINIDLAALDFRHSLDSLAMAEPIDGGKQPKRRGRPPGTTGSGDFRRRMRELNAPAHDGGVVAVPAQPKSTLVHPHIEVGLGFGSQMQSLQGV